VTDLWILVLGLGFFAVAALFVGFCDRIVGPDTEETAGSAPTRDAEAERVGAGAR
jgi:hypothetical protein